jgi:hypothetical protein
MEELIEFDWVRSVEAWVIKPPRPHVRMWRRKGAPERWVPNPDPRPTLSTVGERYFEPYRPAEIAGLFQIFADKPATAEGMRDFFNTFGPLQLGPDRFGPQEVKPGWHKYQTDVSEPLRLHFELRHAIKLFNAGDLSALSQSFERGGAEGGGWGLLRTILRPASGNGSRVAIVWAPYSLIQFLWLQFALFAASDAKLFRCEQCGHPFLVGSKTGRRSKAKYCSDTCRLVAFRERHGGTGRVHRRN